MDDGLSWSVVKGETIGELVSVRPIVFSTDVFLVLAESGIFACQSRVIRSVPELGGAAELSVEFDSIPTSMPIDITIDGFKSPGLIVDRQDNMVRLRGGDDVSASLTEGLHTARIAVQQGGQRLTQQAYVYKERTKQWFGFKPYRRSYAVVVAVKDYAGSGFVELPNAVSQAENVAVVLEAQGFQVKRFYNGAATRELIEEYLLAQLKPLLTKEDRLLVYFSGHGYTVPGSERVLGYFVAAGANRENMVVRGIPLSRFESEYAELLGAGHLLFLLDACFSGLAVTRDAPASANDLREFHRFQQIKVLTEQGSKSIIAAGRKEDKALDENGGIFTASFLRGVSGAADFDHNGVITLVELFVYVQTAVQAAAAERGFSQLPQWEPMSRYGAGEFLFFYK